MTVVPEAPVPIAVEQEELAILRNVADCNRGETRATFAVCVAGSRGAVMGKPPDLRRSRGGHANDLAVPCLLNGEYGIRGGIEGSVSLQPRVAARVGAAYGLGIGRIDIVPGPVHIVTSRNRDVIGNPLRDVVEVG